MTERLKKWQRSLIRNNIERYRQMIESYYIKGKPCYANEKGEKIFSLISPPFASPAARRRVRRIMDGILDQNASAADSETKWQRRTPHVATLAVTYDCQCSCTHCSAFDYREHLAQEKNPLTIVEWKQTIGELVEMGTTCVVLTGGEPLLFKGIDRLISGIDASRCICTLFTNGYLLDDRMVQRLKRAGIFGVYVSLDSSQPQEHDRNRNCPGLFQRAVSGVGLLKKAGIATGLSTFVSREKIKSGEIGRYMDLARELNVIEVFLFDQIPTGRLKDRPGCNLTLEESRQVNRIREYYREKPDYPRIIHQTMFASMAYPCQAEGCPAALVTMHIRANGDVSPCDFTPLSFGNIRKHSLQEIWRSMIQSPLYSVPAKSCRFMQEDFRLHLAGSERDAR